MPREPRSGIYPYDPRNCPFTATWTVIGEKWKGVLWWRLSNGMGRFGELQRAIPQITKKMLTQQLRAMQRDGLVRRVAYDERPARVEYSLTDYGRSLAPVMDAICRWGGAHLQRQAHGAGADGNSTTIGATAGTKHRRAGRGPAASRQAL